MENGLTIELDYQKSPKAKEDESAALRQIARLFADRILETTRLELGITKEDEIHNGKAGVRNNY